MNMRPYEIDLHPELLFRHLAIRDLVRIIGGKSLQGTTLKMMNSPQHVIEKQYIPTPLPTPQEQPKKGILGFFDRRNRERIDHVG
jgi:hypothetical protein